MFLILFLHGNLWNVWSIPHNVIIKRTNDSMWALSSKQSVCSTRIPDENLITHLEEGLCLLAERKQSSATQGARVVGPLHRKFWQLCGPRWHRYCDVVWTPACPHPWPEGDVELLRRTRVRIWYCNLAKQKSIITLDNVWLDTKIILIVGSIW